MIWPGAGEGEGRGQADGEGLGDGEGKNWDEGEGVEGEGGCLEKWEEVGRVCAAVLQRHIAHIPKCRCGF